RPSPPSTLFPYTTLFRSSHEQHCGVNRVAKHAPKRRPLACRHHRHILQRCEFDREQDARAAWRGTVTEDVRLNDCVECGDAQFPDRKSTRLNSSHSQISY